MPEKKYCAVCNSIEDVADYQLKDGPKIRLCRKCANDWFGCIDWYKSWVQICPDDEDEGEDDAQGGEEHEGQ